MEPTTVTETNAATTAETPAKPKRTPKAKAASSAPAAEETKKGLRKPQVRILEALSASASPLTRSDISTKAKVDIAACTEYIGSHDEEKRKVNDVKHFPSLISLSLVKFAPPADETSGVSYSISAKGRQTLERLKKAAK